ncbi:1-acyl-sn-glycerol-3-phosphate acyltransferase [Bacillus inaquosorum]|uniref:1-acyl-sn-glycerol-3-phosphate acyltransferase n=1 Tax=Bacillus inaquosorum TaxID=483913 RepID=UPI0022813A43|nr:1-acyl-sn-glycerol-3-phosphate acyltransferase [Bacillus inaquosorum]MCY9382959.1 1-acyl-sn-glycerol-3-phosphate acyltransferase [Bacillus inaquosorum]MEC0536629.1 1-acyl-sn-glycerol-3-phosphate acyltransferase [Bacillus inaquosorum]
MVRYSLLVVYIVYMLLKNMKQLFNQTMLDPRLSYKKQMTLVYEQPKAFMEGCIGITGSVVTIHQLEPIPRGPVLYVHPRLRLAELALIAGYIEEPAGFIANPKVFRLPFIGQWLNRMDVIADGSTEKVYEDVTNQLEKGQSLILSLDGSIDPVELAARYHLPLVMVETKGTDELQKGSIFKRLKPADIELSFSKAYIPANEKQLRA